MIPVYVPNEPPQTFNKSIFLAGPSPRQPDHPNWRPEALQLLQEMGYDGVVFVPLPEHGGWSHSFDTQIMWEKQYLDMADIVIFWVPRNMDTLPALTTNVEFGMYVSSGKAILGYPHGASHMRYIDFHGQLEGVPIFHTPRETLRAAIERIGNGAERTSGERDVPLHIWRSPQFQTWLVKQKTSGNRLNGARLIWNFRIGPKKDLLFAYALHVDVYIGSEGRNKTNEFVISRPDIATIVAYHKPRPGLTNTDILETEVTIIREFRSPASIGDCFIREVPGGSSWKPGEDPPATAAKELLEETGFAIDTQRLKYIGARQVASTLSAHLAHVFTYEITVDELAFLRSQGGVAHGVASDTERTYVEIYTVRELLEKPLTDWANLGMIITAIFS